MSEFFGKKIDVETEKTSPRPVSFTWQSVTYQITEILREWVDTGFGTTPPGSRVWFNRRHRRYYVVRASDGNYYEIYLDYADRRRPSWWLVSRIEPESG